MKYISVRKMAYIEINVNFLDFQRVVKIYCIDSYVVLKLQLYSCNAYCWCYEIVSMA